MVAEVGCGLYRRCWSGDFRARVMVFEIYWGGRTPEEKFMKAVISQYMTPRSSLRSFQRTAPSWLLAHTEQSTPGFTELDPI